jgi:hypothetical protein
MKYLKKYSNFMEKNHMNIWLSQLIASIGAEEVDIYDILKLPYEEFNNHLDIEYLINNIEFINSLSSLGLKKSQVNNTDDYETFSQTPFKFMFIYKANLSELDNPDFVLIQTWNNDKSIWDMTKMYKINGDIKRFYDKLSHRTIEIESDGKKYIYTTGNSNEWVLQNTEETDDMKKVLSNDEIKSKLKN